jgi:hypothetical protein
MNKLHTYSLVLSVTHWDGKTLVVSGQLPFLYLEHLYSRI